MNVDKRIFESPPFMQRVYVVLTMVERGLMFKTKFHFCIFRFGAIDIDIQFEKKGIASSVLKKYNKIIITGEFYKKYNNFLIFLFFLFWRPTSDR